MFVFKTRSKLWFVVMCVFAVCEPKDVFGIIHTLIFIYEMNKVVCVYNLIVQGVF